MEANGATVTVCFLLLGSGTKPSSWGGCSHLWLHLKILWHVFPHHPQAWGWEGGHSVSHWVGVCRWHCETLTLFNHKNMIPCSRIFVLIWEPVQDWTSNISRVLWTLRHASMSWCTRARATLLNRTRPEVQGINTLLKTQKHELYTLFKTWIPENHTLSSGTSPYSKYRGVPPRPSRLQCCGTRVIRTILKSKQNVVLYGL